MLFALGLLVGAAIATCLFGYGWNHQRTRLSRAHAQALLAASAREMSLRQALVEAKDGLVQARQTITEQQAYMERSGRPRAIVLTPASWGSLH